MKIKNKIILSILFVALLSFPVTVTYAAVSAQVSNVFFSETLQLGSTGVQVAGLQEFLGKFPGIYPEGLVTGQFDVTTENAVKNFQIKEGIEVTGIVDLPTRTKLNNLVASATAVVPALPNTGPIPAVSTTTPVTVPGFFTENIIMISAMMLALLLVVLLLIIRRKHRIES